VLERLEAKGFVSSWTGGATRERGGRAKRFYRIEAPGFHALDEARMVTANPLGRSSRGSTSMSKKQVSPGIRGAIDAIDAVYRPGSDGITTVLEINFGPLLIETIETNDHLQRMIEIGNQLELMFDEADITADDMVPELGQRLLPFLLPRKLRDVVAGDLAQDFQGYVAKFGRTYAVRWYWWELGWLCVSRLSPTAIVAAIAFWLRRKIGF
jgi:DNA-binding PadR family transcriptional regulator